MIPSFQISLNSPIIHGLVTIGKFDGEHPSLACATGAANILIHSPHLRDTEENQEVRQLDVNRRISALTCGEWPLPTIVFKCGEEKNQKLAAQAVEQMEIVKNVHVSDMDQQTKEKERRHALLVGTETNLLCYDVEENADLFYKDVPEGLNAIAFGKIPGQSEPLAIVGGNCSLQGFDHEGNEMFWTVTGDNVTALAFRRNQLIVGSEDYEIRIFEGEDVVMESTESDVIVSLAHVKGDAFAFGLGNGTIGVYDGDKKKWTRRYKHEVRDLAVFDLDEDGEPELITGWSNGRFDVRRRETGQEIFKDRFSAPISGICIEDYRMQGSKEIICCTGNGEIRGYGSATTEDVKEDIEAKVDDMRLEALKAQKMALELERRSYESNLKAMKAKVQDAGLVPQETKLESVLQASDATNQMEVKFASTEGTIIKMVILQSQTMFPSGTVIYKKHKPTSTISVPILKEQLGPKAHFTAKAVVGHMSSFQDHVFETECDVPQFCGYVMVQRGPGVEVPDASVSFQLDERAKALSMWLNEAFGTKYENGTMTQFDLFFRSVYDGGFLKFAFTEGNSESKGHVKINCEDMGTVGSLVQSLSDHFELKDLKSTAHFPKEMKSFRNTIEMVEDCDRTRLRLQADIADSVNLVKALVIKAEDARLLNNMDSMKRMYAQLYELNLELIGEYKKRANNHAELLKHLKVVNTMIQKAAHLRTGRFKSQVVQECRRAIKSNNIHSLVDIFRTGSAAS